MSFSGYDPSALPPAVVAYLDARDAQNTADAIAVFAPDASVQDDGGAYQGRPEIESWIAHTSTEYTYTSTRLGQRVLDEGHVVVQIRLDGNFPGNTVLLRYQFVLADELVTDLTIGI